MSATQVIVVGAGPVGLTLAIDLKQRGVDVLVLEKSVEQRRLPKMERCNARTMEFFRRLGIADRIRAASKFTPQPMDVFVSTSVADPPLLHLKYPSALEAKKLANECRDGSLPLEPYQLISQYTLEPLLAQFAEELGVDVRRGHEVTSFDQSGEGVSAQVRLSDGRIENFQAAYLVGCDGGVSTVRKQLNIALQGDGRIARMLQIFFRSPDLFAKFPHGPGRHVYTHRGSLVVQDDLEHFMINAFQDEDDEIDPLQVIRDVVKLDADVELLDTNPWWLHLLVADSYREGRVFLAGDAVHLVIPQGGLGMNTGIGDAMDLGWKLAGTIQGWGGAQLLDSYDRERRPVGLRNVEASRYATSGLRMWMDACTPDMGEDTPHAAAVRQRVAELAAEGQRRGHEMSGVELGYRYDDSPIVVTEAGHAPDADAHSYTPDTWPGTRLPSTWRADGTALHDQIGAGYTILRLGDTPVDVSGLETALRKFDAPVHVLDIVEADIHQLYGAEVILLRPDLHVVWRGNGHPYDYDHVAAVAVGHGGAT